MTVRACARRLDADLGAIASVDSALLLVTLLHQEGPMTVTDAATLLEGLRLDGPSADGDGPVVAGRSF